MKRKIKAFFKRPVNINMLSFLFIALVNIIVGLGFIDILNYEPETPIGAIFGILWMIGAAVIAAYTLLVGIISIVFAVVSRLVYSNKSKKRLLAYRIIVGIGIFSELPLAAISIFYLVSADIAMIIFAVIYMAIVIALFVITIKNTYSDKILELSDEGNNDNEKNEIE